MAKANTRTGVEGEEDEGVGRDVGLDAVVEEAVRIKFLSYQSRY